MKLSYNLIDNIFSNLSAHSMFAELLLGGHCLESDDGAKQVADQMMGLSLGCWAPNFLELKLYRHLLTDVFSSWFS